MPVRSFLSFAGFIMLIVSTYCPLLRVFGLKTFNLFGLNQPYGIVIMLIAVVGIAGVVLRQRSIIRTCAWISAALVVLLLIAATLKVNSAFSFIPFKGFSSYLASKIKFKWGWYLMFGGAFLALIGALTTKRATVISDNR